MHLLSALGLALVVPSLVLQRVATPPESPAAAPRESEPGRDEPAPAAGRAERDGGGQGPTDANERSASAVEPPAANGAADVVEASGPVSRPRRVRANPAQRRPRADRGGGTDSATEDAAAPEPSPDGGSTPEDGLATSSAAAPTAEDSADGTPAEGSPSREQRRLTRIRERQEAKVKRRQQTKGTGQNLPSISYEDGQAAHVAMVRHVNALTVSLNEAHRLIGRLNIERYNAQRELAIAKKLPLPPPLPDPSWSRSGHAAPHAVRQLQRNRSSDQAPTFDPEELARIRAAVKRRRLFVLGAVVVLVGAIVGYRLIGWTWFPDISDREALTQLAGIGVFIQIFFIAWIFFRFARIGGKGARWLFPDMEEEHRKQRRKQRR